jgi:putative endopeptidase
MVQDIKNILKGLLLLAIISGCKIEKPIDPVKSGVILENMDTTTRPGDDFYQYANGNWIKKTEIPADKSSYWMGTILFEKSQKDFQKIIEEVITSNPEIGTDEQKVGDLYASYMDTDKRNDIGVQPLLEEFKKIDAIHDLNSLTAYFAYAAMLDFSDLDEMNPTSQSGYPFYFDVSQDYKNPTEYALYVKQAGLGLPNSDYYLDNGDEFVDIRNLYVEHIVKMMEYAGLKDNMQTALEILKLETDIANHHESEEESWDKNKMYNQFTIDSLDSITSNFDWRFFLSEFGISKLNKIVVYQPNFITGIDQLLSSTHLLIWKKYLKWHMIHNSAAFLTDDLEKENFQFYGSKLTGIPEQSSRSQRGAEMVNKYIGEMVGKIYVSKHFSPKTKERMEELVANLLSAYSERIKKLDWMGEETKIKAVDKLSKISAQIGYPDKWKDYSSTTIVRGDLFGNVRRTQIETYKREINKIGQPVFSSKWWFPPQFPMAYYNQEQNEVVFTAALLQPPLFNSEVDDAVNYGIVGGLIGHEITHGFDDEGKDFDGEGALNNWWVETDKVEFGIRSNLLVEQYNSYEVLEGLYINGKNTLGENMADLGSLNIALEAYKISLNGKEAPVLDGFTGEQRVFLGFAQGWRGKIREEALRLSVNSGHHSPRKFRVNGVVRNIPEFYTLFNVTASDSLYLPPNRRLKIW